MNNQLLKVHKLFLDLSIQAWGLILPAMVVGLMFVPGIIIGTFIFDASMAISGQDLTFDHKDVNSIGKYLLVGIGSLYLGLGLGEKIGITKRS